MVKQYVQRGDIVWNFPGGGIEEYETPEQACIRETKKKQVLILRSNSFYIAVITSTHLELRL
ncbi:NUDIX hydrolase [Paenibacillus sp. V4I3]|uniref:NUDIX hydrolase n=1 Tax=Paenibacillus sp. V4I3 TaxID=3042305 RepID=UPI0027D7E13A|nr:NUDIX hydrolase [Paenibacillus sp. V4I3]